MNWFSPRILSLFLFPIALLAIANTANAFPISIDASNLSNAAINNIIMIMLFLIII